MDSIPALFRHNESISFTRCHPDGIFFLQQRPEENNAQVLMRLTANGELQRMTAPGVSVRSRLHEYGATPYCVGNGVIYYCRHDTQQIWRQPYRDSGPEGPASAVTPDPGEAQLRYGELIFDEHRTQLICVREDHRSGTQQEPRNSLVRIDAQSGGEGEILFAQNDFVVTPRLSPDGSLLAFISWNHPDMPWDATRLWIAQVASNGLSGLREVQQPVPGAIQQVQFAADGALYFLADWTDWWNLYRLDADALQREQTLTAPQQPIFSTPHDCAGPPWVPGLQHYAVVDQQTVVLATLREAHWNIDLVHWPSGRTRRLWSKLGAVDALGLQGGDIILSCHPTQRPPALERFPVTVSARPSVTSDPSPNEELQTASRSETLLQCCSDAWHAGLNVTLPRHVSFPTGANEQAHGLLYQPDDMGTPPPLLVMVHGGPTGTARSSFNPLVQFWVSQGFAVFDVNHRGSSGYGRRYRQLLLGQWGVIDLEDIVNSVRHLVSEGLADPARVVIRGGSAGGYAVLAALAQSDVFRAGTCFYGISDLLTLAAETHKFESRYVDRLIGPLPEAEARYRERSPIHQLDRIQAPVLWLHGALDKVVPPNQATAIMTRLKQQAPGSRYICFDDEGHGFRLAASQIRAVEEEFHFYHQVGVAG